MLHAELVATRMGSYEYVQSPCHNSVLWHCCVVYHLKMRKVLQGTPRVNVLQRVAVRYSLLQRVVACCGVL